MKTDIYRIKVDMLIAEAEKWVGVHEQGGNNRGPEVEMFQRAVNVHPFGESWCVDFVLFCVKRVDEAFDIGRTKSPATVLVSTEGVLDLWHRTPPRFRHSGEPEPGMLMLWQHWHNGRPTALGHIGIIVDSVDQETVSTVEGNTSAPGTAVEREGNGVYRKTRTTQPAGPMKLLGFLRAWDQDSSALT